MLIDNLMICWLSVEKIRESSVELKSMHLILVVASCYRSDWGVFELTAVRVGRVATLVKGVLGSSVLSKIRIWPLSPPTMKPLG